MDSTASVASSPPSVEWPITNPSIILLLKGILRVDFYSQQKKYLFSKILKENNIILLMHGGHGFKAIKDVEMIEVKQGPYKLAKDKIKFDKVDEKKIKIKKN